MAALTTEDILREEAKAIHGADLTGKTGKDLYQALNGLNSAALCLSGGGIRSAAFALGVIQALATHPRPVANRKVEEEEWVPDAEHSLLAKFHYLSTVSGGGYIGGWLSAWLMHCHSDGGGGWPAAWAALVRRSEPDKEAHEISWLRRFSNYLTPKLGLASADSWAALALWLRNLLLNWFIIIPVLCAALLALKLVAIAVAWISQFDPQSDGGLFAGMAIVAGVLLVFALRFATRERPTRGASGADQSGFLCGDLALVSLAAVLLIFVVASPPAETLARDALLPGHRLSWSGLALVAVVGVVVYGAGWLLAFPSWRRWGEALCDLLLWALSGAVYGVLVAIGIYLYFTLPDAGVWPFQPKEILLLAAGLPWMLTSQLLAEMIFVGLTSYEDGSDSDREWLGRAAGWFLVVALAWLILMCLVFIGSALIHYAYGRLAAWVVGGGASIVTGWLGSSAKTPAKRAAPGGSGAAANVWLAIAAPIFVVALVLIVSSLLDEAMFGQSLIDTAGFHKQVAQGELPSWPGGWAVLVGLFVAVAIGAIASWAVNINRFSLHALYRNRIIRAFLGASNRARRANRFTDFDENDNLRVYDLWTKQDGQDRWPTLTPATWRPFHVVNIALNVVSTKNLAWQERKAEPFSVSALHSGSSCLGYRYSTQYGDRLGISLGTAVAVSGAAASPNMGYHSSPPLALLLTLFNVRLGWWLGNPGNAGEKTYKKDGPATAVKRLLNEMFGQTTDNHPYVYLSDGGHFENLALYEMVRRRCRYIVVSDAGCDKSFEFEDLGNAVRKIAIDLGVRITFCGLNALHFRGEHSDTARPLEPPFHAVGTIHYREADGGGEDGLILYIKPAFHRNRIANVGTRNYALVNADFPHEGTGDQFFSESQFESYRALGFEIADSIFNQALTSSNLPANAGIGDLFALLPQTAAAGP